MTSSAVAEALRQLERDNGRLDPQDVIEAAKNPKSPLHSHFEWDDSAAAAKYRLDQARVLIRSVKIEVTEREVPLSVVAYVHDPDVDAGTSGYRSVVSLRSEEDTARAVLIDEMKRVSNAVSRAKALAAVLGVKKDVEKIDEIARDLTARIINLPAAA